jgi:hypothetical protein
LNWIAAEEISFLTAPPQVGHVSIGGSENFWIRSNRWLQASH